MCQYTTITLTCATCSHYPAHQYIKYAYYLCPYTVHSKPCTGAHLTLKEDGNLVGTDVGRCKVCDAVQKAEDEYSRVIEEATEEYNRVVGKAWERKEQGVRDSGMVVEMVPWRSARRETGSRERHRHRHRHGKRYWGDGSIYTSYSV